ncbi:MAG TPA: hypothetical protein VLH16_02720, partial [Bacteroidales bacterium]|nr:hypothetical protein [Bacteroidales bacterium]
MKILVSSKRYQFIKGAGMFFMFAIAQLTVTLTNGQQHLFSSNKYLFATEIESFFRESPGYHRQQLHDVVSNMQRSLVAGH